ncbi:hypothetical protein ACW0JT_05805 [Arthrobacter sp. SA17]
MFVGAAVVPIPTQVLPGSGAAREVVFVERVHDAGVDPMLVQSPEHEH